MELQHDYEITPYIQGDINHVKLRVNVEYDKDAKGAMLYIRAFGYSKDGGMTFDIFGGVHGSMILDRGWPRKDKKRLEASWNEVSQQIAIRSGPVHDFIVKALAPVKSGLWH